MSPCFADAELAARLARVESDPRDGELEAHLAACARCRARWRALRSDEGLFRELRAAAREAPVVSDEAPGPGGFGAWELIEELHRGGQGVVYRARPAGAADGVEVALKVLLRGRDASSRERARFEREVELVSSLVHPSIPRILAHGAVGGRSWYAMELVAGERLDRWRGRAVGVEARLSLFQEVLAAVAHAHRHGVIHRDLKPANVLVDDSGHAHVLDFGLAKTHRPPGGGPATITESDEFLGTLAYAAPEQIVAGATAVDTRTDVHALGVMLYELLTGELPHAVGGGLESAVRGITEGAPRDPRELAADIDADLATIVLRALAKDPARRYSSAEAFGADLARYRAGDAIEARADSSWYLLRKAAGKHVLGLSLAAAALVLLGGTLAVLWVEHRRADEQASRRARLRLLVEDVLAAARPERMGGDVTLLELFEEVADEIEEGLRDAPDEQAALQFTIGDTYRRLLMPEQAEHHLRAALAGYRASAGAGLDLARCLQRLGLVLTEGAMDEAKALHEEALALRRQRLGPRHALVAESLVGLAEARRRAYLDPEPEEVGVLLEEALAIAREAGDADVLAQCLLASAEQADAARAETLYGEAIAMAHAGRVGDELVELQCLNAWVSFLERNQRFEEAAQGLERVTVRVRELYGDTRGSHALRRWANHHWSREDYAASEELSRQAMAHELRLWSRRRPARAVELEPLAARIAQGADEWLAAFTQLRAFEGDGAWEVAAWEKGIAVLLERLGRLDPAEQLYRDSLRTHCRIWGEDCPIRVTAHEKLAALLERRGRAQEALEQAELAIAIRDRIGRLDDQEGGAIQVLRGRLRRAVVPARAE